MSLRLFLCGDVMTGRGIDQVLPVPCKPQLFEHWARSAVDYVELAERASGPIGRGQDAAYPWGHGLEVLREQRPAARMINLETAVTTSEDAQPGKGIHYRMNPANVACLTSAGIDCCVLANNHVLDWGRAGLEETLATLERIYSAAFALASWMLPYEWKPDPAARYRIAAALRTMAIIDEFSKYS